MIECPMNDSENAQIPEPLSPAEQAFRDRCLKLFSRVDAENPDKGIAALLERAKSRAKESSIPYETALDQIYQEAEERTERRIELLMQCAIDPEKIDRDLD